MHPDDATPDEGGECGEAESAADLCTACRNGDLERVMDLIKRVVNPIDPNKVTTDDGKTPLYIASSFGNTEIVIALLEAGADPDVAWTTTGATPLFKASENGYPGPVAALLGARATPDLPDAEGRTPLYIACDTQRPSEDESLAVVRLLIRAGASVNCSERPNNNNREAEWTPLYNTLTSGRFQIARFLVESGADVSRALVTGDRCWETPLKLACEWKQFEIARLLVEKGACLEDGYSDYYTHTHADRTTVSEVRTPLHFSCTANDIDTARLLLDNGASVNNGLISDEETETPLHTACQRGYVEMARLLLSAGADPNLVDELGWMPIDYACDLGHEQIVYSLLAHNADSSRSVSLATAAGHVGCVRILLEWVVRSN